MKKIIAVLALSLMSTLSNAIEYKPTENERKTIDFILNEDVGVLFKGGKSIVGKELGIIYVTAEKLQNEYSANEARGDKNYKGKTIIIDGVVDKIGSGLGDQPYVDLKTKKTFDRPKLYFQKGLEDIAIDLNKNQKVSFACVGNGVVMGSPVLVNCVSREYFSERLIESVGNEISYLSTGGKTKDRLINKIAFSARLYSILSNDFSLCKEIDRQCIVDINKKHSSLDLTEEQKGLMQEYKEYFNITDEKKSS